MNGLNQYPTCGPFFVFCQSNIEDYSSIYCLNLLCILCAPQIWELYNCLWFIFFKTLVDGPGFERINKSASACKAAFDKGNFTESTTLWSVLEGVCENETKGVNFYNILKWQQPSFGMSEKLSAIGKNGMVYSTLLISRDDYYQEVLQRTTHTLPMRMRYGVSFGSWSVVSVNALYPILCCLGPVISRVYSILPPKFHKNLWHLVSLNYVLGVQKSQGLFGAKPLSEPMLNYCRLDPQEQTLIKSYFLSRKCIWKYCQKNFGYFVSASVC